MDHRARWTAAPDGIEAMLAGADPRTVGRAAAEHGVANLLYLSARELPTLDPELRSLLATVYHLNLNAPHEGDRRAHHAGGDAEPRRGLSPWW